MRMLISTFELSQEIVAELDLALLVQSVADRALALTGAKAAALCLLEDDGIRAFVPLPDFSQRTGYLPAEAFTYGADNDPYTCPQGQELRLRVRRYSESLCLQLLSHKEPAHT